MLSRTEAEAILTRLKDVRILVIGDMMLDRYVFGTVNRISPEAPVPVVHVTREAARPGGASNVALNIAALGGGSQVAGITGSDDAAAQLLQSLSDAGIATDGLMQRAEIKTTVKTRIIAERQQVARVDREGNSEEYTDAIADFCAQIPALVKEATGVIIEDYGKGVICQKVVDAVLDAAKQFEKPVGFDPKDNHTLVLPWLTLATPNYREACLAAGQPERPLGDKPSECTSLTESAKVLSERWGTECLMITLGPHGMYLCPRDGEVAILPTQAREVFDVSGAGDTVIAVALSAIAAGVEPVKAAVLANHAAGVVVGKVGTATCTAEELLASFDAGDELPEERV